MNREFLKTKKLYLNVSAQNRLSALLDHARQIHSGENTVNISYGMASGPCEKIHDLIHLADMDMYNNKKANKSSIKRR